MIYAAAGIDRRILTGGNGISLSALIAGICAERIEVVAVEGGSCAAADKHGAVFVADSYHGRSKNTVAEIDGIVTPADKAAAAVRSVSEETSVESTAFDQDCRTGTVSLKSDEAAV